MSVKLDWGKSVENFQRSIEKTRKDMAKGVAKVVDRTGDDVFRIALDGTPIRTGKMRAGWKIIRKGKDDKRQNIVENSVEYATYVETGTRTTPPRRMLQKALLKAEKRIQRRLDELKRKNAIKFNSGAI